MPSGPFQLSFIFPGVSFLQPVEGYFCKICKKFCSQSTFEGHCKSKDHYDKFVDVVNGKKTKAFKLAIAKSNQDEAESDATKRKTGEEDEEDEDDSGNWKRQRKSEYPVAYEF